MKKILVSPNFKDLLTPNINIGCFPDGDSHVFIPNLVKLRGQKVFLCHRLYPNQNNSLVELILILGLLKKEKIRPVLIVPYLPYARQDKYFLEGEAASAQEICKLFHTLGCQKLITFDCHFLKKPGKFVFENLPIENISLGDELIHYAQKINPRQKLEIIAPDEGASYLVKKQGGKTIQKVRAAYTQDKVAYRHIQSMHRDFEVKGKSILILDDMISTGSTMLKALENLRSGGAKKIFCAATHGFFLQNSLKKLKRESHALFTSDTICSPVAEISIKHKLKNILKK